MSEALTGCSVRVTAGATTGATGIVRATDWACFGEALTLRFREATCDLLFLAEYEATLFLLAAFLFVFFALTTVVLVFFFVAELLTFALDCPTSF